MLVPVEDARWPKENNSLLLFNHVMHGKTGNDVNILIITDHYSRFAQAIKTSNQTALTTAQAAYDHFFSKYGFPEKIVRD